MAGDAVDGRRKRLLWAVPIGVLALALFGTGLGVAISGNGSSENASSKDSPKPPTQVLGTQFERETTTTSTTAPQWSAPVHDPTAPTLPTIPPSTVPRATSSGSGTATGTASGTRSGTGTTLPTQSFSPGVRTVTTSATLPPRLDCGTGSPQAIADISTHSVLSEEETPGATRAIKYWVVEGSVVVSNGLSKAIVVDGLSVQLERVGGVAQPVALSGVAGAPLAPGWTKAFPVSLQSDAQPIAVSITHFAYHVDGIPACAVA